MSTRPLTIAIAALGGQGGGVLSDWIVALAEASGYLAQATSVPGVAQRTGATVYYLELYPRAEAEARGREPVLALYPVPGDVSVVIAAELIEAGRAILRGLVTADRTTLIASSHRVYAIGERTALGDGRVNHEAVIAAAETSAKRFVSFDMAAAAERTGSVISAVLFGALAGSGTLPFRREAYEEAIRAGGKAVEANLAGFGAGYAGARGEADPAPAAASDAQPTAQPLPAELDARVRTFPEAVRATAIEGARRCADFQDRRYAGLYLDRLDPIAALDRKLGGDAHAYRLGAETARYLALQMCYEDAIRVADLKTRGSRFERFRADVAAEPGQLVEVTEYLHPRIEEICDTLPAGIGRYVLDSPRLRRWLDKLVNRGRKVRTTHLSGFVPLYLLARLRRFRRGTLRYRVEQQRIEHWLEQIAARATRSYALGMATAECARLLKGYGETYARGLIAYERIMRALDSLPPGPGDEAARVAAELQAAALADEDGTALGAALERLDRAAAQAPATATAGERG